MASTTSPNMNLIVPGIGTENSPQWATDINGDLSAIDSHNHSSGQGVQITPNGMNINADLAFQNNNATLLRSTRFQPQNSVLSQPTDIGCLYVVGNELYYNDVTGGNNVQITANGVVNATSSGISSGTASAAFSAGVLVVKSSSASGANILMQSAVLTNSGNLTNQLTLQAPTLSGSITETLPAIPVAQSFMTIDASGSMAAYAPIANGITRPNLAAVGQQISASCGTSQTISGSTFTAVTNLSVTITTSGRPVFVMLQGDGTNGSFAQFLVTASGSNGYAQVAFSKDGGSTFICGSSIGITASSGGNNSSSFPASSFQFLDSVSAGTYNYVVYAKVSTALAINPQNTVLVAYEL